MEARKFKKLFLPMNAEEKKCGTRRFPSRGSNAVLLRHPLAECSRKLIGETFPAFVAHLVLEAVQNLQNEVKCLNRDTQLAQIKNLMKLP
jgi:hypothetical protein